MKSGKIKIAIVGVGNCASALVQGLHYYGAGANNGAGLITPLVGGYGVADVEVVAAFDVDARKVGRDVSLASGAEPNCTLRFVPDLPLTGVTVQRGPTLDGVGEYLADVVVQSDAAPVDVAAALKAAGAAVVVNYLPVGSEVAARFYAEAALAAGCAFVNCVPVFLASDPAWAARFAAAGLPLVGDDIKSQVGATIVHRALAQLFRERGVTLDHTYQLNFGGNTDFQNMLERQRLASKKVSKTRAVTSVAGVTLPARDVHVGPSDHVPWLDDRKWAHIRLEGRGFGGAPTVIDLKLEVHDSPNSAGVVMDAVRCARVALDRGEGGALREAAAWYFKSPPEQADDDEAQFALWQWLGEQA